jgi:hypothetical protein
MPNNDSAAPKRLMLRKASDAPKWLKSKTDSEAPNREKVLRAKAEPK